MRPISELPSNTGDLDVRAGMVAVRTRLRGVHRRVPAVPRGEPAGRDSLPPPHSLGQGQALQGLHNTEETQNYVFF